MNALNKIVALVERQENVSYAKYRKPYEMCQTDQSHPPLPQTANPHLHFLMYSLGMQCAATEVACRPLMTFSLAKSKSLRLRDVPQLSNK